MELSSAIGGRRSIREYRDQDVPEELVDRLLMAAIQAPSAGNRQSWEFVVVRDVERKEDLARAASDQEFLAKAPVILAVCADRARSAERYGARGADLYCIQDCAAATQNLLLTAFSMGLGTCWVGAFDEGAVSKLLQLPEDVRPLALVPVGYPAEDPEAPPRFPMQRIVHHGRF
ncbi:MAG: nitroreductase family protein [Thermoplasmata archaeon]